jgi:peptide/nickel transport system substrate-binding protein
MPVAEWGAELRKMIVKPAVIVSCAAVLLALAQPAAARDTLTIGVSQFPSGLHPYIDPEAVKGYIEGFALRPVTAFDADWKNTCRQCIELPSLQNGLVVLETGANGAPGMAITVKLKPDLKWADGEPVTARDLAFTARVGGNPASGFADTRTWGRVERVDIVDDHTAVMHLDEVWTLYDRIPELLPEHIEGPIYARAGSPGEYIRQTAYSRAPATPGLYNGPWMMTEFTASSQVVLDRNPYWSGPAPYFRRIVVRDIENTAALQANLLSGDIDFTPGEGMGLSLDQVLALQKRQPDRFQYIYRSALTYLHIDYNLDNPILADVRVRKALLLGLDRKAMNDKLFDGHVDLASAWVAPKDPMYAADLPHFDYDPAQARALLDAAGWKPGTDGIRRNAGGKKLSLEFRTGAGNNVLELIQQVAQSQWKQIGVETTIRNESFRSLFGESLKKRSYSGLVLYSWLLSLSYPPRQLYAIDMIPTAANNWSGSNYMDWRNPTMDAGIRTAETELDPAKRLAAWSAMQHAYADDLPVLPLFFRPEGHVIPKWLLGYRPTGLTDYTSYWAEEWHAE